jgi:TIGR00255 family protein
MLKSMTGYGVVQGKLGSRRVAIETKSVNHKFCEINLRLSPRYTFLEGKIAEFTKSRFNRGRIDVLIKEESPNAPKGPVKVDMERLKGFYQDLKKAAKVLKIPGEITLSSLLNLPQVLLTEEEEDLEAIWKELQPLLKASFVSLEKMRVREGQGISRFFTQHLAQFAKEIQAIEAWVPKNVELHRVQLLDRIQKLSTGVELDPQRLSQEVAYFVDRSDISEELQRLESHVAHFRELLGGREPVGRKLDFLVQEMNREVNTLSAKAQNAEISRRVVECKHLLEKMREQVQNVE